MARRSPWQLGIALNGGVVRWNNVLLHTETSTLHACSEPRAPCLPASSTTWVPPWSSGRAETSAVRSLPSSSPTRCTPCRWRRRSCSWPSATRSRPRADLQTAAAAAGAAGVLVKGAGEPDVRDDGPAVVVVDPAADWGHVISLTRLSVSASPAMDGPEHDSLFALADALAGLCGGSVVDPRRRLAAARLLRRRRRRPGAHRDPARPPRAPERAGAAARGRRHRPAAQGRAGPPGRRRDPGPERAVRRRPCSSAASCSARSGSRRAPMPTSASRSRGCGARSTSRRSRCCARRRSWPDPPPSTTCPSPRCWAACTPSAWSPSASVDGRPRLRARRSPAPRRRPDRASRDRTPAGRPCTQLLRGLPRHGPGGTSERHDVPAVPQQRTRRATRRRAGADRPAQPAAAVRTAPRHGQQHLHPPHRGRRRPLARRRAARPRRATRLVGAHRLRGRASLLASGAVPRGRARPPRTARRTRDATGRARPQPRRRSARHTAGLLRRRRRRQGSSRGARPALQHRALPAPEGAGGRRAQPRRPGSSACSPSSRCACSRTELDRDLKPHDVG